MTENQKTLDLSIEAQVRTSGRADASHPLQALADQLSPQPRAAEGIDLATLLGQIAGDVDRLRKADERREREARGSVWSITLAMVGLFLTVGMPYYLPLAGKEQQHLTPQFQMYEASFRPDIERARDRLREARAGLPMSGFKQEYSSTQREVMQHLLLAYAAAGDMSIAQTQMTMFLTQIAKNLDHQQKAGLLDPSEAETLAKAITSSANKAMGCAREAHVRADVLVKALSSSPGTTEGVAGLVRAVNDMKDLARGKDHPSLCIDTALGVRAQLAKAVDLHDAQVEAFNAKARRDAGWLKIAGAFGAVLLFVYGRPATRSVPHLWRIWRNGRRRSPSES